ncbi:hypothetical protein [Thermogemmatispora onikobensis]|jgi:hypothetical protein|uniref:hypothetical protein n=1 Tax=Thermogemmatispora onikobensis TaxID=732234 RepID=UPI00159F18AD|nr:hypothetical protein [Thermogemmatispora onikobensis]
MLKEYIRKIAGEYGYPIGSILRELIEEQNLDKKNIEMVIDKIIDKYAKNMRQSNERG